MMIFFFFNDTATTEIYTLSLHDALPISVTLDNIGSDKGQLRPMSERLAEVYGVRPGEHLVDGGFAELADIEALATAGVAVVAPAAKATDAGRGPGSPRGGAGPRVAPLGPPAGGGAAPGGA